MRQLREAELDMLLDQGPEMILLTVVVYFIVQQVESNLIIHSFKSAR